MANNSNEPHFFDQLWAAISQNIGTKLISVIIAVVLWVIVLGSRNVEATKEIPVEIVTAKDVIPANEIPEKIAFRLAGPKAFLRAVLDRRDEPIRVNLAGNKPGVVTYRFFADNIRLPIGVKVLSISPTVIPIKLEYIKRRDVPVKVEIRGAPPDGLKITKVEVHPEVVRIVGAESRVEGVTEIPTTPIDVSDLRQTTEKEAPLELAKYNVQLEGPLPKVTLNVETAVANYRIKNVDVRVITHRKFKLEEKSVTVLVHASPKDLKTLDRSHVYAVLDLTDKPAGQYDEQVKVTLPENVGLVKVIPEHVRVTLY